MQPNRFTHQVSVGFIVIATVCLTGWSGCGRPAGGAGQVQLAGTVSYEGKPVPAGRIELIPDSSKGYSGPAGYAEIFDGRYTTARNGKGVMPGPHVAVLSGFRKAAGRQSVSDEEAAAQSSKEDILFREVRIPFEVTSSSGDKDFQIPSQK